jgi:hypothetical protein
MVLTYTHELYSNLHTQPLNTTEVPCLVEKNTTKIYGTCVM